MNELTFDQITFKASNNSHGRKESVREQLTFHPETPYNGGCMALEFDIQRHSSDFVIGESIKDNYFTVPHSSYEDETLSGYFNEILTWHNDRPDHEVILITLNVKNIGEGFGFFTDEIDTYLKCYFGEELIFKPNLLLKDPSLTLCQNVVKHGWPKLSSEELKGKFIFCLSGNRGWKAGYAENDINKCFCFCDKDESDSDEDLRPPENGNIVFFNFRIYNKNLGIWGNTIPLFVQKKLITRTYISDSEMSWRNCITANVNVIATNQISGHKWCMLNNKEPFRENLVQKNDLKRA